MSTSGLLSILSISVLAVACCAGQGGKEKLKEAPEDKTMWAVLDFEPKGKGFTQAVADSFTRDVRKELSKYVKVMDYDEMVTKLADTTMVRSQYCRSIECLLDIGDLLRADVIVKGGMSTRDNEMIFFVRALDVDLGIMIRKVVEARTEDLNKLFAEMPAYLAARVSQADTTRGSTKSLEELQ
jgi:hypothetical protein